MKILACGPFIGDFEQEITTFRPYCRWLQEVTDYSKTYISTHFNRSFLYDFIPEDNMFYVMENISRKELGQKGYIHENIQQKDYTILTRKFRDFIIDNENCNKKDIDIYNMNYIKSTPPYPIHNKRFTSIRIPDIKIECKNKIVLIPHKSESEERLLEVYKFLNDKYDCIVMGDMKSHLPQFNILLELVDYIENGWKYIIKNISNVKAVICPISYWTTICNLQGTNVFSWGENVGQHREGGIYNFRNKNIMTMPSYKDTDITEVIDMIERFLEDIYEV